MPDLRTPERTCKSAKKPSNRLCQTHRGKWDKNTNTYIVLLFPSLSSQFPTEGFFQYQKLSYSTLSSALVLPEGAREGELKLKKQLLLLQLWNCKSNSSSWWIRSDLWPFTCKSCKRTCKSGHVPSSAVRLHHGAQEAEP